MIAIDQTDNVKNQNITKRVFIESKDMRIGCALLEKIRTGQKTSEYVEGTVKVTLINHNEVRWTFKFEGKNVGFADVLRDFNDPKYGRTAWFTSFEKADGHSSGTPVFEVILWSRLKAWR
ncbi:MAG: hypothetical protein VYB39_03550 [Pseudomonadota bacterium]|nr:hypothetical protein [Pseudomonadota bacterium]